MKTYFRIMLCALTMGLTSCEDVIDVELQKAPERLTVEASIDWEKGSSGSDQLIKLSKSSAYFDTSTNTSVSGASVMIRNNTNNAEFIFVDQNNGTYTTTGFVPILGQSYTLEIIYDGEVYTATETMVPVTDIIEVTQSTENGFNEDDIEINLVFQDPAEEENYYLFKFQEEGDLLPFLEDGDDEFINGNEIDWWYEKEEDDDTDEIEALVPGDVVFIDFYAISESYHNYIRILIEQNEGAGLFSATPVALKGNCLNTTNVENYAHGYFRLSQVVRTSYTVQ